MTRKYFYSNRLRHAIPFAAASFTVGLALFACSDKDIDSNENNGKALVAFNVSEKQDEAQAAAKANQPMTRAAFTHQLALQDLAPEDLTMQKLPVQGKAGSGLCLIETTLPGVPSQLEATAQTRADITTMPNMGNFSTTAFYGSSDTSLEPWFYDKDTKKDGNLVAPIYWDWIKNHGCFYAVYPKPDNNKIKLSPESHTGTPYVDFEVEPNVTNQKDLMTACSGNVHTDIGTMSATAPRTDLTFRHALTAVRFKVGSNLSWNKTISKVEIIGAKSKGRYTLSTQTDGTGAQWSNLDAPTTFALDGVSVSTSQAVNQIIMGNTGDNYTFYMIPQPLVGVSVKIYFSDSSTPISVNLSGTWKPGTTKTYALSQNTSTWQYQLTVSNPAVAAYTATTAASYTVQSYRTAPDGTQQAVAWKVVGYDANNDGNFSMGEKPAWLTSLSKDKGDGGTSAESGTATLTTGVVDLLAKRNKELKEATAKGSVGSPYDLSTHKLDGTTIARSTANSYVISAPGYYQLPLVYGNAITNGTKNEHSYKPTVTGSNILANFKDHANQDITDPWITQSNGGANAPDNAKVVWADESGLVTNLGLTGSGTNAFVKFEVPASAIKNGNAVIAVTKGGTVVWSWHLWFAPQDVLGTVACKNFQNKVYNFTNETLGLKYTAWSRSTYSAPRSVKVKVEQTVANSGVKQTAVITITQNNGNVRQGYNTFYQFGRKDAFPGTNTLAEGSFSVEKSSGCSLQNTIQHPDIFYGWNSGYYNVHFKNIWSADNTSEGFNDNPVVKTVYDPCPAGFKMPASNAFTGFTTNGQNNGPKNVSGAWDYGWNFNNKITSPDATVYFPASGYRYLGDGSLYLVGNYGYCWSAVPYDTSSGCSLYFYSSIVGPQNSGGSRASALPVRPVSE